MVFHVFDTPDNRVDSCAAIVREEKEVGRERVGGSGRRTWEHQASGRKAMSESMTISEIQSCFDSEWVLLEDPETTESLEVMGGRVLCHSKDRSEVYRKAIEVRPRHSAVIYTGKFPEDMVIIL